MARAVRLGERAGLWSRTAPATRLLIGALIIAAVGFMGQTPKSIFGFQLIWPHAALLGAAGWGMSGHRFSPMVILVFLGLIQDVSFEASLGCFVLVNLGVYGLTAFAAESLDVGNDPVMRAIVPVFTIAIGFLILWAVASATSGQMATIRPLVGAFAMTLGLHFLLAQFFDLGVRAGENMRRGG